MDIVAVDLAAKFSAVCWLDEKLHIYQEWSSWRLTETSFIDSLFEPWAITSIPPAQLVVEDLPHRLPFAGLVRQVCRMQGRIIEQAHRFGNLDRVLFVPPDVWRNHYPGLKRGTGADAVVPVAAEFGYTPPDLSPLATNARERQHVKKIATDYCAAYLIGRWALDYHAEHGTFEAPRTSRYPNS